MGASTESLEAREKEMWRAAVFGSQKRLGLAVDDGTGGEGYLVDVVEPHGVEDIA